MTEWSQRERTARSSTGEELQRQISIITPWLVKSLGDVLNSDQGIIDLELCNGVLDTKTEPANKMHIGENEMFSTPSHVVAHLVLSIILTSNLCQCNVAPH